MTSAEAAPANAPPEACRILLVDDNHDFLTSMERFLASEPGLRVVGRAYSGGEALEQVGRLRPRVVIMDVSMPGMNGFEATRALKARPGAPRIVILSMHEELEFRQAALDSGADGFVPKSGFGTELIPLVRCLCAAGV